jgi:hypothetical protein
MSFSTRNPEDLTVGKTYTFTRDINGFSYKTTFTGARHEHITYQESQWTGSRGPLDKVYEFTNTYPNGATTSTWVWAHTLKDGGDGVWTA